MSHWPESRGTQGCSVFCQGYIKTTVLTQAKWMFCYHRIIRYENSKLWNERMWFWTTAQRWYSKDHRVSQMTMICGMCTQGSLSGSLAVPACTLPGRLGDRPPGTCVCDCQGTGGHQPPRPVCCTPPERQTHQVMLFSVFHYRCKGWRWKGVYWLKTMGIKYVTWNKAIFIW